MDMDREVPYGGAIIVAKVRSNYSLTSFDAGSGANIMVVRVETKDVSKRFEIATNVSCLTKTSKNVPGSFFYTLQH